MALFASFLQSPGLISADTKLDLTGDPIGFLGRAAHLWSSVAPLGQVQNQAYGYFFPHGAFFALGDLLSLPAWITQRLWWALLLWVGFVGFVRLADALGVGSRWSRIFAALVFVASPRVLTTIGSISSETLPVMLAPWVLAPVVMALGHVAATKTPRRLAFESACALALMGAVNAVATVAAASVAIIWWLMHTPLRGHAARWWRFGVWWLLGAVMACLWWIVPLLILSQVSPPFLDFIESSRVTTEWVSLTEVLRGTSSWTPFVSPERVAGAGLVTQPAAVVATGILAAAGLTGLAMRAMPARGRLTIILIIGLLLICLGYPGQLGSPIGESVRVFLDGAGAPLRNVHKWEPLIRIPLTLGIAHLLARVPTPDIAGWRGTRGAFAHPERSKPVAAAVVVLVALLAAGSMVWTRSMAAPGSYSAIPSYWSDTAKWLEDNGADENRRALVVPGSPFANQTWGLTRDEPLQVLADEPWAVRDAIPLTPPGAIRAMDSVQRSISEGRPMAGLAATLAQQGISYVVVRADLDPSTSRSTRPVLARNAIAGSPGMTLVAGFGPEVGPPSIDDDIVSDSGLRPKLPAISIYEVDSTVGFDGTRPATVPLEEMPRVFGGPESLAQLQNNAAIAGEPPLGPVVLQSDAQDAGLPEAPMVVTDSPTNREVDFGRVDDHSSGIRTPDDPRLTQNAVADYPVDGQPLVQGQWLLDEQPDQVSVSTSGSASDATQLGQTSPGSAPAAAFDGNPNTSWVSRGLDSAVGQWLQLDFTAPRSRLALDITLGTALGPGVSTLLITTEAGSTVASGVSPGTATRVVPPSGPTRWIQIRAIETENHTAGNQFVISEVELRDAAADRVIPVRHRVVLPELVAGQQVSQWSLGPELPGRAACVADGDVTLCSDALSLPTEEPGTFGRVLSVPSAVSVNPAVTVTARPSEALTRLLSDPTEITATGDSAIVDPRGAPMAAVDGDPGTSWIARIPKPGEARPTLSLHLPTPQTVSGLKITVPPRQFPADPLLVGVDLGNGRQVREVGDDGVIRLNPLQTSSIAITVLEKAEILDANSLGFADLAPTGVAEVEVLGSDIPPADPDRPIEVDCSSGPGLTISGGTERFSLKTTAGALRSGAPIAATPCGSAPLALPAGEQELAVNPGDAFSVAAVTLTATNAQIPRAVPQPTDVTRWDATDRRVEVTAAAADRVLIVPESVNTGWEAHAGDTELTPLTVNGWQQGWIIPAGYSGAIHLTYPLDQPYRWSIGIGLALVALLFIATLLPTRRTPAPTWAVAQPIRAGVVAPVLLAGAVYLLTGPVGLIISAVVAGAVTAVSLLARRTRHHQFGAALVAIMMLLATFGLASGPWRSSLGYTGWDWWVQLPALLAVVLVAWLTIDVPRWLVRLVSRRPVSRRHG
ncbi:UNVERIFIED_CONTAM: arabinofuranan 3-O-arabinosyltransferase [Williamsia faeni]